MSTVITGAALARAAPRNAAAAIAAPVSAPRKLVLVMFPPNPERTAQPTARSGPRVANPPGNARGCRAHEPRCISARGQILPERLAQTERLLSARARKIAPIPASNEVVPGSGTTLKVNGVSTLSPAVRLKPGNLIAIELPPGPPPVGPNASCEIVPEIPEPPKAFCVKLPRCATIAASIRAW